MKTQLVTNKGTQIQEMEIGIPNWAGKFYEAYQEEEMASLPANTIILTKRGTVGIRVSEYPKSRRRSIPVGTRISCSRGTAIRTL